MKKTLLMLMAVVMVGCGTPSAGLVGKNNANMAKLSVGITKTQVLEIMGPAGKTEGYETKSGGFMEFLFYRTQVANTRGTGIHRREEGVTDRHWTPISIIDGKLKGWGRNFYDDTIKIRKEIIKK